MFAFVLIHPPPQQPITASSQPTVAQCLDVHVQNNPETYLSQERSADDRLHQLTIMFSQDTKNRKLDFCILASFGLKDFSSRKHNDHQTLSEQFKPFLIFFLHLQQIFLRFFLFKCMTYTSIFQRNRGHRCVSHSTPHTPPLNSAAARAAVSATRQNHLNNHYDLKKKTTHTHTGKHEHKCSLL